MKMKLAATMIAIVMALGILQASGGELVYAERFRQAKEAVLKEFGEPIKGTYVDVRCTYNGGPSSIYVIALNHNQSDNNEVYLVIVNDELRGRKSPVQVIHIDTED